VLRTAVEHRIPYAVFNSYAQHHLGKFNSP
jgi:hypothetical protein